MPSKAVIAGAAAASAAAVAALLYFLLKQDEASATSAVPGTSSGTGKPSTTTTTASSGPAITSEPVGAASTSSTTAGTTTAGKITSVSELSPEAAELYEKSKAVVERALNGAGVPTATPEEIQALLTMSAEEQAEVAGLSDTSAAALRKVIEVTAELAVVTRKFVAAIKARMDAGELTSTEAGPALSAFMQYMDVHVPVSHGIAPNEIQAMQAEHESKAIMQRLADEMRTEISAGFNVVAGDERWPVERFVDLLKQMAVMTVHHMEQVKEEVLATGLRGEAAMQQFHMKFMLSSEQHQASILQDLGITQEQFQANLMAHMNDPVVQEAMQSTGPELEERQRACMTEW